VQQEVIVSAFPLWLCVIGMRRFQCGFCSLSWLCVIGMRMRCPRMQRRLPDRLRYWLVHALQTPTAETLALALCNGRLSSPHVSVKVAPVLFPLLSSPEYVTPYTVPSSVIVYASAAFCALEIAPARIDIV